MRKFILGAVLWVLISTPAACMVINEIMYHPRGEDEVSYEWLELYNDYLVPLDISGWSFSNGITFTFAPGTIVPGKDYLVVCANVTAIQQTYDIPSQKLVGNFEARLENSGERIELSG